MKRVERNVLVDTGPLVAAFNAGDQYHEWARSIFASLEPPLLTCEAVLSEAQHLVASRGGDASLVLQLIRQGVLEVSFSAQSQVEQLLKLQRSYRNLPMSFADACLVRMAELQDEARVFTTDTHFRIYRRNARQIIPVICPY